MISLLSHTYLHDNLSRFDLCSVSTDAKPAQKYLDRLIANGSSFIEMDTGSIYFYNAETDDWIEFGG